MARDGRIAYLGGTGQGLYESGDERLLVVAGTDSARVVDTTDGHVLLEVPGFVARADFIGPRGEIVDLHRDLEKATHELYVTGSGLPLVLPAEIAWLENAGAAPEGRFVVAYQADPDGGPAHAPELRRGTDGSVVATLPAVASAALFSDDGEYFVAVYPSPAGLLPELRASKDGALIAALPELRGIADAAFHHNDAEGDPLVVKFGPAPTRTILTVAGEPPLLRSTSDGSPLGSPLGPLGPETDPNAVFSPDGSVIVVNDPATGFGEMRTANGQLLASLPAAVESTAFQPGPSAVVVISYFDHDAELRRVADGDLIADLGIDLATPDFETASATFSSDSMATYVAIPMQIGLQLRVAASGELVDLTWPGSPAAPTGIAFGPEGSTAMIRVEYLEGLQVRWFSQPDRVLFSGENVDIILGRSVFFVAPPSRTASTDVRDAVSGELIRTLPVSLWDGFTRFTPDEHVMVVSFPPDLTGAGSPKSVVVDLDEGTLEVLSAGISNVEFSADSRFAVLQLENDRTEVWATDGPPHRIANVGGGVTRVILLPNVGRLAVVYRSGAGYLLDLPLITALAGDTEELGLAELEAAVCNGPFSQLEIPPDRLRPYFGAGPAPGCGG
jgi:hypothetical protein